MAERVVLGLCALVVAAAAGFAGAMIGRMDDERAYSRDVMRRGEEDARRAHEKELAEAAKWAEGERLRSEAAAWKAEADQQCALRLRAQEGSIAAGTGITARKAEIAALEADNKTLRGALRRATKASNHHAAETAQPSSTHKKCDGGACGKHAADQTISALSQRASELEQSLSKEKAHSQKAAEDLQHARDLALNLEQQLKSASQPQATSSHGQVTAQTSGSGPASQQLADERAALQRKLDTCEADRERQKQSSRSEAEALANRATVLRQQLDHEVEGRRADKQLFQRRYDAATASSRTAQNEAKAAADKAQKVFEDASKEIAARDNKLEIGEKQFNEQQQQISQLRTEISQQNYEIDELRSELEMNQRALQAELEEKEKREEANRKFAEELEQEEQTRAADPAWNSGFSLGSPTDKVNDLFKELFGTDADETTDQVIDPFEGLFDPEETADQAFDAGSTGQFNMADMTAPAEDNSADEGFGSDDSLDSNFPWEDALSTENALRQALSPDYGQQQGPTQPTYLPASYQPHNPNPSYRIQGSTFPTSSPASPFTRLPGLQNQPGGPTYPTFSPAAAPSMLNNGPNYTQRGSTFPGSTFPGYGSSQPQLPASSTTPVPPPASSTTPALPPQTPAFTPTQPSGDYSHHAITAPTAYPPDRAPTGKKRRAADRDDE